MALCICFTIECGSPGILKTMSSSMISRLTHCRCRAFWAYDTLQSHLVMQQCVYQIAQSCCLQMNVFVHWSRLAWYQVALIWRTEFFVEILTLISWERDIFLPSWTTITSCVIPSCPDLPRIGFGIGWVGWTPIFNLKTFGNTTSSKYSLRDDCIRSNLRECQSFSNHKINIDQIYLVLMFVPCVMQILCMT